MPDQLLADIQRLVDFGPRDAERLRAWGAQLNPRLDRITDQFYARLTGHPGAARWLSEGDEQLDRLRQTLRDWLGELTSGAYGDEYLHKRLRIGETHGRIGLPQHYMLGGLEVVAQCLREHLPAAAGEREATLAALQKLLAIEAALMLETYREQYSDQVRDVERAAVRERLNEAEHLAQIGRLSASLAHEIKNPLAGISGAVQVLREPLAEDHPHRPILGEILRQIDRLDGTVKDLLVYSRPKPPRFTRCSLNKLVERVLTVLHSEPDVRRVGIEFVDSQKLDLYADEGQLEQLLINLLLNATQASPSGAVVRFYATSTADGLRLIVEDQGQGMEEEVVRRAFEPFYTTKSKGTGLGLPICRKIVDAHGGTISIQSVPGKRTTVAVRLPRFPPASSGGQTPDEYSRLDRRG